MDYKAGMAVYALAFLTGSLFVQNLAELPAPFLLMVLSALACLFTIVHLIKSVKVERAPIRQFTLIIPFIVLILIGIVYTSHYAGLQLSSRLNDDLIGENIIVRGRVLNIPVTAGNVQRFEFTVDSYRLLSTDKWEKVSVAFPDKVRLSWYYGRPVNAGERWQLEVRLKPPHGFMNHGGFDYEAWLFQHGIDATGYVRKSSFNSRQQVTSGSIDFIRQSLSRLIDTVSTRSDELKSDSFSLVKALAVGDKTSISNQQWRVLANTGTSHLMAISGLHIGLASLFAYVLIRRSLPVCLMKRIPAQHVALLAGLLTASLYALIAGLSIPTQRAMIMLLVLSVMILVRRNHRPADALGFALLLVLLVDPLAILSAGFWFSFSAVAVIFISITTAQMSEDANTSFFFKLVIIMKRWVRLQLMISLFLLPLSLFMFQQVSLVSPVANLLLIPYVSFLVVPVVLLAIIFAFLLPVLSDMFFTLAAALLDFIWPLLSFISSVPYAVWVRGDVGIFELLAATAAIYLLLFSRQVMCFARSLLPVIRNENSSPHYYAIWVLRSMAFLVFVVLLTPAKSDFDVGEYQLTVLDVGQGSAAVIQTQNHVLVFDAGARFSDRMNVGSAVVVPYLRSLGVSSLNRLIISHGDADHIGGAQAILDEYPDVMLLGQDIDKLQAAEKQLCAAGTRWHWDGVDFEFLLPDGEDISLLQSGERNNNSCVLQVVSTAGSVLLTGDIEKKAEQRLLDRYGERLASDILMVPHHGSKTSSSRAFIKAVNPELSLISVGYKNRYRLPNDKVLLRYTSLRRVLERTDESGAISVRLMNNAGFIIEKYRVKAGKYWHHTVR